MLTRLASKCIAVVCARSSTSPIAYSTTEQGCTLATCGTGEMFSNGQAIDDVTCVNGVYKVNGAVALNIACGQRCDGCTPLTDVGLTCPTGSTCVPVSEREGQCPELYCPTGSMVADGVTVPFLTCTTEGKWLDREGTAYNAAFCVLSCTQCGDITNAGMPCPQNLICSSPLSREGECKETYCPVGDMTGNTGRTPLTILTCNGDSEWVDASNNVFTSAQCEERCDTCTTLTTMFTCPTGSICSDVTVDTTGQCPVAACEAGVMKADPGNVEVTSLKCDGTGNWVDDAGTVYTSAHCEVSCTQCTAMTNAGMLCPQNLICTAPLSRDGQCKETYCAAGLMTGNTARTPLTILTCNGESEWVDTSNAVYTSAQCEQPCDQCTTLTDNTATCPTGFICSPVTTDTSGQCPSASCTTGTMKANPGNVEVTSLSCDGNAKWVDAAGAAYTSAQCESPCTECTALTNTGMTCPKNFVCEAPTAREGQCSESYCPTGTLTGNPERTQLTVLTCNAATKWVDAQSTVYTVAQCELPCNQCAALTNNGMTCPTAYRCTTVMTNTDGQCPQAFCPTGSLTAGTGRTTVTSLTCNGMSQWVDPMMAVYSIAQCETSCTCAALPITPSPSVLLPSRGNSLGTDASGCSTLVTQCRQGDRYRLVTSNGVVTLEPPAGRTTPMTCVAGKWMATINGAQVVVQQQACYNLVCTECAKIVAGPGVVATVAYHATTWCLQYTLSGCPNGYKVGPRTVTSPLTCDNLLRWTSGPFNGPVALPVTVTCA
ncbi:hypothetical protein Q1695_008285 [Nippostrongylus brasiliensis]|nr:hypothetical protein Q1695_008285 [Nippostrongylus brasiliensis]